MCETAFAPPLGLGGFPSGCDGKRAVARLQAMDERDELAAISLEEAAGISSPLYDIVDVLFELQSRGYFRRQVRYPLLSPPFLQSTQLPKSGTRGHVQKVCQGLTQGMRRFRGGSIYLCCWR